jgi:predicted anti-sigma-YlaC factor YlaD
MCNDTNIQELLPAYLEKTLDPATRTRVEHHLASCEECRAELALLSMIADDPVPVPDEAFWTGMPERIYREIQIGKQQEKKRLALSDFLGWTFMPRFAWATAAIIVIAAVSWFMVRPIPKDVARMTPPATGTALEDSATEPVNLSELSSEEFDAAAQWAQNEFTPIEEAITNDAQEPTSRDLSEDLSELSARELDRIYEMLNKKEQDAREKLKKRPVNEKRMG